jgi:hypothetical protein
MYAGHIRAVRDFVPKTSPPAAPPDCREFALRRGLPLNLEFRTTPNAYSPLDASDRKAIIITFCSMEGDDGNPCDALGQSETELVTTWPCPVCRCKRAIFLDSVFAYYTHTLGSCPSVFRVQYPRNVCGVFCPRSRLLLTFWPVIGIQITIGAEPSIIQLIRCASKPGLFGRSTGPREFKCPLLTKSPEQRPYPGQEGDSSGICDAMTEKAINIMGYENTGMSKCVWTRSRFALPEGNYRLLNFQSNAETFTFVSGFLCLPSENMIGVD